MKRPLYESHQPTGADNNSSMTEFRSLIPGLYTDNEARIYINMREFIAFHQLPDKPESREVIWGELLEIFDGLEVFELRE